MKKRTVIPIIVGLFFVSVSLFTDTPYQRVLASSAVLTHGPLVGGVTANTARVFVRTNGAAEVQVRYAHTPDLNFAMSSVTQNTRAAHDYTTTLPLTNLTPAAVYYFDILVNGVSQLTAPYPQFKTFPTQGAPASFKFLMITDYHSATTSPTWFNAPAAENPDFVIIGGDFGKVRPMPNAFVKRMRLRFKNMYSRAKNPGLVDNILRRYPVAHMWDDHDFGANNVDKTFPNKHAALGVLQEYFPVYPMTQYGDWQKFSYGNADFFLLDSRSQRDPVTDPDDANKSMLDGDNLGKKGQLEWLKSGLLASTARWKFIVSPDPFNPTVGKPDAWAGFKHERRALVNFIRSHHIGGIILLPGDIHLGAIDDGTHSDFPEMVTPGIISDCGTVPFGPGTWSEGIYWTGAPFTGHCFGYGVITVDAVKDQVRLEVKNSIGKTQLQLTVQ